MVLSLPLLQQAQQVAHRQDSTSTDQPYNTIAVDNFSIIKHFPLEWKVNAVTVTLVLRIYRMLNKQYAQMV